MEGKENHLPFLLSFIFQPTLLTASNSAEETSIVLLLISKNPENAVGGGILYPAGDGSYIVLQHTSD